MSSIPPSRATAPNLAQLVMSQLNPQGLSAPASFAMRTLRRGQHLYWPGDTPVHVYSILRGALKTYRISADSSEWISGFHFPGEVLGLDAVIDRPVRGGAIALNSVTVCLIPVQTLVDCLNRSEPLRSQLLARFGDEITRLEEHLSMDALSAERRLASFILWMVDELSDGSAQQGLSLPMSHKEIGNYLRLVPETVSRLLGRFQERGWLLVRRGRFIVRELEQLRLAAGGEHADAAPALSTGRSSAARRQFQQTAPESVPLPQRSDG